MTDNSWATVLFQGMDIFVLPIFPSWELQPYFSLYRNSAYITKIEAHVQDCIFPGFPGKPREHRTMLPKPILNMLGFENCTSPSPLINPCLILRKYLGFLLFSTFSICYRHSLQVRLQLSYRSV